MLGIPVDNVTVNVPLLGGAFGRKSKWDYVLEAALVSKASRRADQADVDARGRHPARFLPHRVGGAHRRRAWTPSGKVVAWRHRSVAPTIASTFKAGADHEAPFELGMGLVDNPFDIPNLRCENGECKAHTRIGWFRSVSNIPHGFAVQSMVAEIAAAQGRDPKEMLLELIGPDRIVDPRKSPGVVDFWNYGDPFETYPIETGRLRHVAELAAERAGWGKTLPKGEGLGIAAHRSFLSYVATVVHVAVDDNGGLAVRQVDTAIDCGVHINPERIRSQIEGAAVMGLALAKHGQITFKNGVPEQSNFDSFVVARMDDAPLNVRTHIVPADWICACCRCGRARAAAVRTGTMQCDPCGHRQADSQPANRFFRVAAPLRTAALPPATTNRRRSTDDRAGRRHTCRRPGVAVCASRHATLRRACRDTMRACATFPISYSITVTSLSTCGAIVIVKPYYPRVAPS